MKMVTELSAHSNDLVFLRPLA